MSRHSSFGTRLGAFRNRQARLAFGRDNRRYYINNTTPEVSPQISLAIGVIGISIIIATIICAISTSI